MRLGWPTRLVVGTLVLAVYVTVGWGVPAALADPVPSYANPCSNDINPASCERLTFIAQEDAQVEDAAAGVTPRLDLVWIGVWFSGGVAFGSIFGRTVWGEVRKWHGGFR